MGLVGLLSGIHSTRSEIFSLLMLLSTIYGSFSNSYSLSNISGGAVAVNAMMGTFVKSSFILSSRLYLEGNVAQSI